MKYFIFFLSFSIHFPNQSLFLISSNRNPWSVPDYMVGKWFRTLLATSFQSIKILETAHPSAETLTTLMLILDTYPESVPHNKSFLLDSGILHRTFEPRGVSAGRSVVRTVLLRFSQMYTHSSTLYHNMYTRKNVRWQTIPRMYVIFTLGTETILRLGWSD